MLHEYDILLRAQIEIGGKYRAHNREEALAAARMELRPMGALSDESVERCVMLDEPDPADLPVEAYDPK